MDIPFESTAAPTKYGDFYGFRVGTCEGLWRAVDDAYEILATVNTKKHNGHFQRTMQWFESSARRDRKAVRVLECWNLRLARNLKKNGYRYKGGLSWTWEKKL